MKITKERVNLKEAKLKQGDKATIEFAVLDGHMPCPIKGYSRYFVEVLKVTKKSIYFYLLNHLDGKKLDCKLQVCQIGTKYETCWEIRTKTEE